MYNYFLIHKSLPVLGFETRTYVTKCINKTLFHTVLVSSQLYAVQLFDKNCSTKKIRRKIVPKKILEFLERCLHLYVILPINKLQL